MLRRLKMWRWFKRTSRRGERITRIYLTNGDPFVLGTDRLVKIAELVHQYLPEVEVLTCYASIQNLKAKSLEELKLLKVSDMMSCM